MKIKKILIIIIITGSIFIPILFYYIGETTFLRKSSYELNWNINIPTNYKKIYHNQNQHDFQGKGIRYTIFLTKENSTVSFVNTNKKTKVKIQTIEGSSKNGRNYDIEEFVQTILTDLNIPKNNRPKFDEYYEWKKFQKHGSMLIILYLPNVNRVYFIENLI